MTPLSKEERAGLVARLRYHTTGPNVARCREAADEIEALAAILQAVSSWAVCVAVTTPDEHVRMLEGIFNFVETALGGAADLKRREASVER